MSQVKSFRDLVEAINKKKKYDTSPDDDETSSLEPRSDGEKEFKDVHVAKDNLKKNDYPEQNDDASAGVDQSKKQGASLGRSGVASRPEQGTSKVSTKLKSISAYTAQTPLRRGDADNVGDMKPVVLSKSAVNPNQKSGIGNLQPANLDANNKPSGDREVVHTSPSAVKTKTPAPRKAFTTFKEQLEIRESNKIITPFESLFMVHEGEVTFNNGDSCVIDEEIVPVLVNAFEQLSEDNKETFRDTMNESIENLLKIIDFVVASQKD